MTMTRLWLVTLLSLLFVQGLLALPLGVHPNEAGKYSGDSFKCGAISIKSSQINDNYCDCTDGSDEPGTNACANSKFWCVNRGYIGKYVFSSFVNDGVCDCCDGSDESNGPNACENTCMNVGSAHRKKMYEDLKRFREGAAIKQKWIEHAKENRGTGDVSIQAEKEAVEILNQQYDALSKQVDNLKGALKKARKLIDEIDRAKERIDDEADSNNRAFDDEDDDGEKEETEQELSLQDRLSIFQEAHGKTPQELVDEHNKVKRERDDLRSKLNDAQSKLKSAEKLQALNFGPDDAFYYLYDKTFELRHPQYTYTLRPFFEVKQAHTTIGEFEGWSDDTFTTQLYKRGQRCWGIGERETSVKYECGSETKIIAVDEPSPCVYAMTVETPAACNVEAIHKVLQDLGLSEEKLKEEFEKTNGLFNWVW